MKNDISHNDNTIKPPQLIRWAYAWGKNFRLKVDFVLSPRSTYTCVYTIVYYVFCPLWAKHGQHYQCMPEALQYNLFQTLNSLNKIKLCVMKCYWKIQTCFYIFIKEIDTFVYAHPVCAIYLLWWWWFRDSLKDCLNGISHRHPYCLFTILARDLNKQRITGCT